MVCKWCAKRAQSVCKWCANGVQMVVCKRWCANGVQMVCKACAKRVQMVCKACAKRAQSVCKWCTNGVQMVCKWRCANMPQGGVYRVDWHPLIRVRTQVCIDDRVGGVGVWSS